MKTVSDLCEDDLVRALLRELPVGDSVIVGPGDDCAVVAPSANRDLVLKTDCLVENVHFLRSDPAQRVGWKAIARVVSDFAAMAAIPTNALVTAALPPDLALDYLLGIYRGMRRCSVAFGISIIGGETARTEGELVLSIAMQGECPPGHPVLRSTAKNGHLLFVTGALGASFPSGKHLRFRPRLAEALWLRERFPVSSMMDLSDGLASDLPRLAAASGVGFEIHPDRIPRTKSATLEEALRDGEDYELLFSLPPEFQLQLENAWKQQFPRTPLSAIGQLSKDGKTEFEFRGWEHFSG